MRWLIVACVLLAGCSSGGSSRVAGTTGSTSGPISGPAPQATALGARRGIEQFVLDWNSGGVWTIISGDATAWFDDATLLAPFYSRTADRGYRLLRLDGSSTFVDAVPPTPAPREISTTSADGEWRLVEDGSTAGVEETNGSRRITVPKNDTFAWSPSGHVLATGGGRCGNVPVVFVDPAAEPPTRTVDVGARITRSYQWRPDGSGIALAVILNDSQSQVLFVSAVDAALHVLVPVGTAPFRGEPSIGPWSPSGTYLLFGVYSGRPCPY